MMENRRILAILLLVAIVNGLQSESVAPKHIGQDIINTLMKIYDKISFDRFLTV